MHCVRIYEMPDCSMVSSGVGMFGEEKFEAFDKWFSSQKRGLFPKDFLFSDGDGFHWLYMYEEGMEVPGEFEVIDFKGGLYAVVTDVDMLEDRAPMHAEVDRFLIEHGLERDPERKELGNIITSPLVRDIMGFEQMDYYTPVRRKSNV